MSTLLRTNRLLGDSATVPADYSGKIGYAIKALTTEFGTLLASASAVGALANTNRPLGILQFCKETTAADITAAAAAVAAGEDPAPFFARGTIVSDGYALAVAGATITPGTHNYVKTDANGAVIPLAGTETGPIHVIGSVDTPQTSGAAVSAGDFIQIHVKPQIIYLDAAP